MKKPLFDTQGLPDLIAEIVVHKRFIQNIQYLPFVDLLSKYQFLSRIVTIVNIEFSI